VRVLVVDDHLGFRQALTSALEMVDEIEVAGEAEGGLDACREAADISPDVVLMDLSMPDLSGFDAMERIHDRHPGLPVVILTANADPDVESEAWRAGASGFVAKGTTLDDIVIVLQGVAEQPS
jgi:DNA-binding NarL/FixJ family response regulator